MHTHRQIYSLPRERAKKEARKGAVIAGGRGGGGTGAKIKRQQNSMGLSLPIYSLYKREPLFFYRAELRMLKGPKPLPLHGLRGLAAIHVLRFFCRAELRMLKSPKPVDPLQGLRGLAAVQCTFAEQN